MIDGSAIEQPGDVAGKTIRDDGPGEQVSSKRSLLRGACLRIPGSKEVDDRITGTEKRQNKKSPADNHECLPRPSSWHYGLPQPASTITNRCRRIFDIA